MNEKLELNSNPPYLLGFFSEAHLVFQPPPVEKAKVLFGQGETCGIFQVGDLKDVHFFKAEGAAVLFWGRLYDPPSLPALLESLAAGSVESAGRTLESVQGSFVLFQFRQEQDGPAFFISTDKYGFRRLIYYEVAGGIYFATHFQGLRFLFAGKSPRLSEPALLHYYNFGFTANDQTLWEGLKKVPPGTTLARKHGRTSIEPYFSIADLYHPKEYIGQSEVVIGQVLDARLLAAASRRLPERGPAGVALSGGVDSGYLAQKLVQAGSEPIGYNLAYGGFYDEFGRVDRLSQALNLEVRKITASPVEIIENFEAANEVTSEPAGFNNASLRILDLVARKDGVQVLFDGDGADRLFLGMSRYLQFQKLVRAYRFIEALGLARPAQALMSLTPHPEIRKASIHFKNWSRGFLPYAERDLGGMLRYDPAYEKRIYDLAIKRFRERFEEGFPGGDFGLFFTFQAAQMVPEMFFHDPSDIQTGLGLRPAPAFWDDELVSLALSLPTSLKLRKGKTKYILRQAAGLNLDPSYWMLPKIGLQSAYAFVLASEEGRAWRQKMVAQVLASEAFAALRTMVPAGAVNPDRLIPLAVWKTRQGLS